LRKTLGLEKRGTFERGKFTGHRKKELRGGGGGKGGHPYGKWMGRKRRRTQEGSGKDSPDGEKGTSIPFGTRGNSLFEVGWSHRDCHQEIS